LELVIAGFGLTGTMFVTCKGEKLQMVGMYLWLISSAIGVYFFFTAHMHYLVLMNLAYAAISIMGIQKRGKGKK
jgi:hypothetical protein